MTVLTVDPVSAKTLPALDRLFSTDTDKYETVLQNTNGDPLKRLVRASIARQNMLGYSVDPTLSPTASLLEDLIRVNLQDKNPNAEEKIDQILNKVDEDTLRLLLKMSVLRYNILGE